MPPTGSRESDYDRRMREIQDILTKAYQNQPTDPARPDRGVGSIPQNTPSPPPTPMIGTRPVRTGTRNPGVGSRISGAVGGLFNPGANTAGSRISDAVGGMFNTGRNTVGRRISDSVGSLFGNSQERLGGRPWESGEMGQYSSRAGTRTNPPPVGPQGNPELDALLAQITSLTSQPDTPGQWISPYSQDYLNELANRLQAGGASSQEGFNALNPVMAEQHAQGLNDRTAANSNFFGNIAAGAKNLGVDLASTNQGQTAAGNIDALTRAGQQNLAAGQGFNTKMGELYAQQGNTLGLQAREGLLTPKQWQGPQSGLSDGEQAQLGFLMDQYNRMLDNSEYDRRSTAQNEADRALAALQAESELRASMIPDVQQTSRHDNPEFAERLSGITDPALLSAIQSAYDMSEGDIPAALASVQERLNTSPGDISNGALAASPIFSNLLNRIPSNFIPSGLQNNVDTAAAKARQDAIDRQIIEFLRSLSPTYAGQITNRTITNSN